MPGTELHLPGGDQIAATASGDYTVQSGDNLWNIARDHMGGGQNWQNLFHSNEAVVGVNPDMIHPGQHLNLDGAQAHAQAHQQLAASHTHHAPSHPSAHAAPPAAHKVAAIQPTGDAGGELKAQAQSLSNLPNQS